MSREQIIKDEDPRPASIRRFKQQSKSKISGLLTSFSGFTLVELLMVVALIGILATLSIPAYTVFIDRAKNGRAKSEVRLLETEINAYRFDTNSFPANLAAINRAGLLDPWGNAYVYSPTPVRERFGEPLNDDYDLCSMGRDGLTPADGLLIGSGADDLVRGRNGIFVGSGAEF